MSFSPSKSPLLAPDEYDLIRETVQNEAAAISAHEINESGGVGKLIDSITQEILSPLDGAPSKSMKPLVRETTLHRAMAIYRSQGYSPQELADMFDLKIQVVRNVLKQPFFIQRVLRLQAARGQTAEAELKTHEKSAIAKMIELMETADPGVQLKAAQDILNRVQGTPIHRTENRNMTLTGNMTAQQVDSELAETERRMAEIEQEKARLRGSAIKVIATQLSK